MKPSPFDYLEYRDFLRDLLHELKKEEGWNLRRFAQQAGISSPGYLKMVIDGQRNLSLETARKFCCALGIEGREKIYFERLVLYSQTKDPDLKLEYFEDLVSLRPPSTQDPSLNILNRYLSKSYYSCVREMVLLKDFREDPKWIAKRCLPPIRPAEAREALQTLLELSLLERGPDGKLRQAGGLVQTENRTTQVAAAFHFHQAILQQARQVLGRLNPDERHYHAMTFALPKVLFSEIINEFYRLREQILEKSKKNSDAADEVYQINFQFYPVTQKGENP